MNTGTGIAICLATALAHSASAQPAPKPLSDLPVRRVVLFSSGVGYFEHTGTVSGQAHIQLMFKTDQINDVLKSMVLIDAGGAAPATVTYGSNDPIERSLRSFGVDLSGNPTLPELLDQLRGAHVVVTAPQPVEGSILNVEARTRVVGSPPARITDHVLNLVDSGSIRSIPLATVQDLYLSDQRLQEELAKALKLLIDSRNRQRRPVQIHFAGQGQRQVRVGYLIETPVWKTSYRLDLTPAEAKQKGKGLLQGWAIVENTSDNDWHAVQLALVSGRPISFIQDLYTPLYMPRPVVVPERYASLRPQRYEAGMAGDGDAPTDEEREVPSRSRVQSKAARSSALAPDEAMFDTQGGGGGGFGAAASVAAMASAAQLGELFHFAFHQPVDLARRGSAMLPIVNELVGIQKVSIYNQHVLPQHPLNGVELTNDTAVKLLAGPVTAFDGGAYAGDAQLDYLAPKAKRLLSYAVDLSVKVDPSARTQSSITAAKIVRGVLVVTHVTRYIQTYAIDNGDSQARKLIVEHPYNPNRKLVQPSGYREKTASLYRFDVEAAAGKVTRFVVEEQHQHAQTIAIADRPIGEFQWYSTSGEIPRQVREALAKVITKKQALADLQRQRAQLSRQLELIDRQQQRLRENLKTVGAESQLGRRYLQKLNDQETQIEQIQQELRSTEQRIATTERELADLIHDLNVT